MNAFPSRILCDLNVALQPLLTLATRKILGYEALARPGASPVAPPTLFEAALAGGWIAELDLTVAGRAFDAMRLLLAPEQRLFINVHPASLETPGFAKRLRRAVRASRVVVEVTEQGPITKPELALANVDALRDAGALFALDDFGSGYAHMRWLHDIRPQFLKISQAIGSDFELAPWRRSVVQSLHSFAKEVGCAVIVEGIETAATAAAAREMGIEYGQGYFFSKPITMAYSSGCGTSPSAGSTRTSFAASTSPS